MRAPYNIDVLLAARIRIIKASRPKSKGWKPVGICTRDYLFTNFMLNIVLRPIASAHLWLCRGE